MEAIADAEQKNGHNDIELAYLREIRGSYADSRKFFTELNDTLTEFDGTRSDHISTRLYFADMLTMDGRLREASQVLYDTYQAVDKSRAGEFAELVRHRGHAHRFSFDFGTALSLYAHAQDSAPEDKTIQGELMTNIAETRCWTEPNRGVSDALRAVEFNSLLDSGIEVAKAEAALAVALSGTGQVSAARAACSRALAGAQEAKYPAGAAFAHQARVVVEVRAGASDSASRHYKKLTGLVSELSTYGHLCVVPAWLLNDEVEVAWWSEEVSYVSGERLADLLALTIA